MIAAVTRRTFLAGTAAGVGAILMPASAQTVGVALLGCDHRGMTHLRALTASPEGRVCVLCDPEPVRREEARRRVGSAVSDDWQETIQRREVDAVIICLPVEQASEAARHALVLGKPVLMPFAAWNAQALQTLSSHQTEGLSLVPETLPANWPALGRLLRREKLGAPMWCQIRYGPGHNLVELLTVLREAMALSSPRHIAALRGGRSGRFHVTLEYDDGLTVVALHDPACVCPRVTVRAADGSACWANGELALYRRSGTQCVAGPIEAAAAWLGALRRGELPICSLRAARETHAILAQAPQHRPMA